MAEKQVVTTGEFNHHQSHCQFDQVKCGSRQRLGHTSKLCAYYSGKGGQADCSLNSVIKGFLTIEHLNAQSLEGNLEEIKLLATEGDIDILCIS